MNDLMNHDDGLSPAARAALASMRADDDLPADARERVWARLAAAPAPSDMSRGTGSRGVGLVIGLALAAGVALALVNLGRGAQQVAVAPGDAAAYAKHGGAGAQRVRAGEPGRAAVPDVAPAPEVARPVVEPAAIPREQARREPGLSDRPVRAAEMKLAPVPDPSDTSTLAAETALLQTAQAALAAGDPTTALARLDEHRQDHANGVLARERDALRVTALCDAGRRAQAREAAETFVRLHPASMLAERVQGVCVTP